MVNPTRLSLLAGALIVLGLFAPLTAVIAHAPAQLPGRDDPVCLQLNGDGTWIVIDCPDPTPEATYTPIPSNTPSPTATATATNTPLPPVTATFTPSPTPPPVDTATPTQEIIPVPTITTEPPALCEFRATRNINKRSGAGTGYSVTGLWAQGTYSTFTAFVEDAAYLWAQHSTGGWSVVALRSPFGWWVSSTPLSDGCVDVEGWPGYALPQEIAHNAALLWHTVPGFNIGNARVSHTILANKGIEYGYKTYADMGFCLETLAAGGTCIYRHPNMDCPQSIGSADPIYSARAYFADYGRYACDMLRGYPMAYYEPTNECLFGDAQHPDILYWWREWMLEYLRVADDYGCPKLVLPTLGPGYGEPMMYQIWAPALNANAARGGLVGEHAYQPYLNSAGNYDLCPCDPWLACRHRFNEDWRQAQGIDIDVAITEAARGWGGDPVSVSDFVCWYNEVRKDNFVHSVALWLIGYHPTWPQANLDNYVIPLAQSVGG